MRYTIAIMQVKLLDLQSQYRPIRDEIRAAIDAVCDEQSLILGKHVETFEHSLAGYCGTRHAVGVSSGTDALLCALMGMGVGPGDEVICPSFTFFATAGSIARLGATPVFVDVNRDTFNIDPTKIAAAITSKTRAIMPVHLFGQTAAMEPINKIACENNLLVIEDAAQAIGAKQNGKRACALGFVGCLSFYPTKNLGAFGDAGAICTNDDELAERCRKLRVHGSGHTYYHEMIGGMFRLAAIQAAVLNVKLKYLESWHEARRRHAAIYDEILAGCASLQTPRIETGNWSVYNQYVIRVTAGRRDELKQKLADRGIGSAIYYPLALHEQACFRYLNVAAGSLPETELACREVLALPVYPELSEAEIRHVATTICELLD